MTKTDPLLEALIARLPEGGTAWPRAKRDAWFKLMSSAFDLVYEDSEPPKEIKKPTHEFIIDENGFVMHGSGQRLLPKEVSGPVHDYRGEDGDLRTIIWADDAIGLGNADITVVAA